MFWVLGTSPRMTKGWAGLPDFVKAGKNRAELVFSAAKASACCPPPRFADVSMALLQGFLQKSVGEKAYIAGFRVGLCGKRCEHFVNL